MRNFVKRHFETLLKELVERRPSLKGDHFKKLSIEDMCSIEEPFGIEEVKEMIWTSAKDKSSGPYGFNSIFSRVDGIF